MEMIAGLTSWVVLRIKWDTSCRALCRSSAHSELWIAGGHFCPCYVSLQSCIITGLYQSCIITGLVLWPHQLDTTPMLCKSQRTLPRGDKVLWKGSLKGFHSPSPTCPASNAFPGFRKKKQIPQGLRAHSWVPR